MSKFKFEKKTDYQKLYHEKLRPTFWVWVIAISLNITFGMVFIPISIIFAYVAIFLFLFATIAFLINTTPEIIVTKQKLFVGKAQIEIKDLANIESFSGEEAQAEKTTKLKGLAYLCIRGWVKDVVKINIMDTSDPTPYWLVSSRSSEKLKIAIIKAKNIS